MTAREIRQVLGRVATDAQVERLAELDAEVRVVHRREVRVVHRRPVYATFITEPPVYLGMVTREEILNHRAANKSIEYLPTGGRTTVYLSSKGISVEETAWCSMADHFNRRRGIQIALGRALKELNLRVA